MTAVSPKTTPQSLIGLISERRKTHGDYAEQSKISENLIQVLERSKNWPRMSAGQKQALRMIAVKQARILTGDPTHEDSWLDISGYAQLSNNHRAAQDDRPTK